MPTSRFHRTAAIMLLVIGGCGELANQDAKPPALATMHRSLLLAATTEVPQGKVRVALVWHLPEPDDSFGRCDELADEAIPGSRAVPAAPFERRFLLGSVQQAIDIAPQFPSAFTLKLTALPPPEAIWEEEDGLRKAEGTLVVYRDGNGNSRLDPATDDAASPDQVLSNDLQHFHGISSEDLNVSARAWGYQVWYLDRPRKYSDTVDLHSGFNVLEYQSHGARVATEITLELLPTPELQAQLCTNQCLIETPIACPTNPAELPAPPAGAVSGFRQSGKAWVWENGEVGFGYQSASCISSPGGYSFTWHRTIADGCSERQVAHCAYGPAPAPSPDWPCDAYLDLETRMYTTP